MQSSSFLQSILANRLAPFVLAAVIGVLVARLIHDTVSTHDRKMRPLLIASIVNVSLLALIWAGEWAFQKSGWLPAALAWIPQHAFLPLSSILVIVGFVRRNSLCVWINAAAALFVAGILMGIHVAASPAAATASTVRVMTFDVDNWKNGTEPVAEMVKEVRPQVFCLQNAGRRGKGRGPVRIIHEPTALSGGERQRGRNQSIRELSGLDELEKRLPSYHFVSDGDMAIGSKLSLDNAAAKALPPGSTKSPALIATVYDNKRTFTVINVCLMPCDTDRAARDPGGYFANFTHDRDDQARELLSAVKSTRGPILVCGNFNGPPQAGGSQMLSAKLQDAFDQAGNGYGFTTPSNMPYLRTDRILMSPGVSADAIWNPGTKASTHLPVVADVVIPARQPHT